MKITTADYLAKRLAELKITHVFGLPGDYNFNILDSIVNNPDLTWVNSTNELNAAYAADGYARINGFGAVVTTYGVGELSAINGIAGSYSENVPVMKITGIPKTAHIRQNAPIHHNFSHPDYYAFSRAYANVVEDTAFLTFENAKDEIDRVFETFVRTRKPVYIALPVDVCYHLIDDKIPEIKIKSDDRTLKKVIEKIEDMINKAEKPLIITDYLVKRFRLQSEVREFVKKFNIKICSMIMGKGLINEDDENFTGMNHGKLSGEGFRQVYENCDLLIGFGTLFSDLNTLGFIVKKDEKFKIDIQANYTVINNEKFENVFINDVIEGLLNSLNIKKKEFYPTEKFEGYKKIVPGQGQIKTDEIFPIIQDFLKPNDTVVIETGIISFASSAIKLKENSNYMSQTMWGSIGWAGPASFGASLADKSKRTVLFTGEGSFQLAIQEMANMFKYNTKPVIFLLNNKGYTIERLLSNDPDDIFNDITPWDYKKAAELFSGGKSDFQYFSVKTPKELYRAVKEAEKLQKEKLCFIEIFTGKTDIPEIMKKAAKCIRE